MNECDNNKTIVLKNEMELNLNLNLKNIHKLKNEIETEIKT